MKGFGATLLIGLVAVCLAGPTTAATPRGHVVLEGGAVTLGDVFADLPAHADAARYLAPAPALGESTVLRAHDLARIARALELDWRPQSWAEAVTLTRPATVVDARAIEGAVARALAERGAEGEFAVVFEGDAAPRLALPAGVAPEVRVVDLDWRPSARWFAATLTGPPGAPQTLRVTGRAEPLTRVPVLAAGVERGATIARGDIVLRPVPSAQVQGDTLLDPAALAGMAARRTLPAGAPLRALDVEPPRLVDRGDTVTLIYRDGPLALTAMGRALERGARGQVIRVTNTNSARTVEGRVTAPREVTVEGL